MMLNILKHPLVVATSNNKQRFKIVRLKCCQVVGKALQCEANIFFPFIPIQRCNYPCFLRDLMTFKDVNYAFIIIGGNFKVFGVYCRVQNFRCLVCKILLDQWERIDVDALCKITVDKSSVSHPGCHLFGKVNDASIQLNAASSSVCAQQFIRIVAVVKHFSISAPQNRNGEGNGINDIAINCTSK